MFSFVFTGDLGDMWLRDSAAQVGAHAKLDGVYVFVDLTTI